jgi:hypothetical protein
MPFRNDSMSLLDKAYTDLDLRAGALLEVTDGPSGLA